MTVFTPKTPVELAPTRARGGLLAAANPAPDGWENGLIVPFYGCGEPIVRNKCITAEDDGHRPRVVEFPAFPIEQGSTCSTLSRLPHSEFAVGRLDATTEWALGRQLQDDIAEVGSPTLNEGTNLGVVPADGTTALVTGLACLEAAAAATGFGERVFIHASPKGATWLGAADLIRADGTTHAGSRVITSPGYVDPAGDVVRVYATGAVWAAVSAPTVVDTVGHRTNDDLAMAMRGAVAAFDPCISLYIDITVPACPVPPDESPAESPAGP